MSKKAKALAAAGEKKKSFPRVAKQTEMGLLKMSQSQLSMNLAGMKLEQSPAGQ